MKKVFLTLAVVATVACLASCKKSCTCKSYLNGEVTETREYDLEELQADFPNVSKCSDLDLMVDGTGVKCK